MHERSEVRERKDRKTCREAVSGVQSQSKEKLDRGWENGPVRCKSQPGRDGQRRRGGRVVTLISAVWVGPGHQHSPELLGDSRVQPGLRTTVLRFHHQELELSHADREKEGGA